MRLGAVVLDELAALGLTDVVVCPGSRSAPLAYAALALEQAGRIRLHTRIDERSACFLALGIAKASGVPVAIITTSGTAAANLAPALLEARHSYVPVIALTADRPSTLVGTGANQTTDQVGLLGSVPRLVARLSSADDNTDAWRAAIRRAFTASTGRLTRLAGPVQVNIELTPPLSGDLGEIPTGVSFSVEPPANPRPTRIDPGRRAVIVAGDMPPHAGRLVAQEAERAHVPLLAEPSSNARRGEAAVSTYRYLLPGLAHMVERVIVVGHPTLSRPVASLLARKDIEIIVVGDHGEWVDPGWVVSRVVSSVSLSPGDPTWLALWKQADRDLRTRADQTIAPWESVAWAVWASLGEQDPLVVGASSAIRDLDIAPISANPPVVYANRGLAGIDGTISTTLGVGIATRRRVTALLGDLTALHDVGGLAIPVLEERPDATLIVMDDQGGSIFSTLEYGRASEGDQEASDGFERVFAVRMGVDCAGVAEAMGWPVARANAESFPQVLGQGSGPRLIHVQVERDSRRARDKQWAAWGRASARGVLA
jgi:2-succinyl-5-enolpyruvyl-6-hydroxy-3-cyclohexene-1-carboxylate synthase